MRIDAHHHFWRYDPAEYEWIPPGVLRRDYLPHDLQSLLRETGIDGVISVQARQNLKETRWLLDLARENDFIKGVVGWVPLIDPNIRAELKELAGERKLVGVRHVLQDEPDEQYALREDFNRGVAALKDLNLRYDILIYERHLPAATRFVDLHPSQVFVLDHVAKPRITSGELEPWRSNVRELARRENVYCKVSGMATEADHAAWTPEQLRPYFDTVLDAFGPRRLMFGTDWPVCLLATTYARWHDTVGDWTSALSAPEREWIFGRTAMEAYRLKQA